MAVAKVILNGTTLIDTTQKTVTAADMAYGVTALKNDGTDITGTMANGDSIGYGLTDNTLPIVGVGAVGYAVI